MRTINLAIAALGLLLVYFSPSLEKPYIETRTSDGWSATGRSPEEVTRHIFKWQFIGAALLTAGLINALRPRTTCPCQPLTNVLHDQRPDQ